MTTVTYAVDYTGLSSANLIVDEAHTLTEINSNTYRTIIPTFAPFYLNNVIVKHVNTTGNIVTLTKDVDYTICLPYVGATNAAGIMLFGGIWISDLIKEGTILLTYQTIGGSWCCDVNYVLDRLAEYVYNPKICNWDNLTNVQDLFPVIEHEHGVADTTSYGELVSAVNEIASLLAGDNSNNSLLQHLLDRLNPHGVSKEQVGLGSVENLALATDDEVNTNLPAQKYVTLRQLINYVGRVGIGGDGGTSTGGTTINLYNSVVTKTATYNCISTDYGKLLRFVPSTNRSLSLRIPSSATLYDGWCVCVANDSETDLEISSYSNETIDGVSSRIIKPGYRTIVCTDGTNLFTTTGKLLDVILSLINTIESKADLISPSFSGSPTAPTATAGTTNTVIANTMFVTSAIANALIDYTYEVATQEIKGLMSSSDKIKLDGIEEGAQVNDTALAIRNKLKTVDGISSGIDADLLDGLHASAFSLTGHKHVGLDITDLANYSLPVGAYIQIASDTPPTGFLICNGAAVGRLTYPQLFEVIGTKYGAGDGSTTFNLPNLIGRVLQGGNSSGTYLEAGLPNITGYFGSAVSRYSGIGGVFYNGGTVFSKNGSDYDGNTVYFDAKRSSSVYKDGINTVQPPALTSLICIKAYGGSNVITEINQSSLIQDIANLSRQLTPVGTVITVASNEIPTGYIPCNGAELLRSDYNALFSYLGTTWGSGDGSTTFNIPDFRDRVPQGTGSSFRVGQYMASSIPSHYHAFGTHWNNNNGVFLTTGGTSNNYSLHNGTLGGLWNGNNEGAYSGQSTSNLNMITSLGVNETNGYVQPPAAGVLFVIKY